MKIYSKSLFFIAILIFVVGCSSGEKSFHLGTTTTLRDSGLLNVLIEKFNKETGISIHPIINSTGSIVNMAKKGDVDIVLVHHKPSEMQMLKDKTAIARTDVMYSYFVLVGPKDSTICQNGCTSIMQAFQQIKQKKLPFISRGDNSGTHYKELEIWKTIGQSIVHLSNNIWYDEVGNGMGQTLLITSENNAYTITDLPTWEKFQRKKKLKILYSEKRNTSITKNPYGLLLLNPANMEKDKFQYASTFYNWLNRPDIQNFIDTYRPTQTKIFHKALS